MRLTDTPVLCFASDSGILFRDQLQQRNIAGLNSSFNPLCVNNVSAAVGNIKLNKRDQQQVSFYRTLNLSRYKFRLNNLPAGFTPYYSASISRQ